MVDFEQINVCWVIPKLNRQKDNSDCNNYNENDSIIQALIRKIFVGNRFSGMVPKVYLQL